MDRSRLYSSSARLQLPRPGQRILKTSVAVLICLLFYCLRGYRGGEMPTEAAITAIICMQPYVRDTRDYAVSRMIGSLIGGGVGLLFLLLLLVLPPLGSNLFLLYPLMAFGVLISLYLAVLLNRADSSSLAAIVFICVVISFPDIVDPLCQAVDRITGILVGTFAAILVNVFRLPRDRNPDLVFFVRTGDLAPDRFSPIPAPVLYRLRQLSADGARICLISEHAPAFFSLQMQGTPLRAPLIVMDGAAIYDSTENTYLSSVPLSAEESVRLRRVLDGQGLSYFIYTVHKGRTCIFHHGPVTQTEQLIFDRMKSSPYRSYLEGEIYEQREIVYFKLIARDEELEPIARKLEPLLPRHGIRCVIRPQGGARGISGLYLYSDKATVEHAQARLMDMLREKEPSLRLVDLSIPGGYRSEHDAMHLLHQLGRYYEPVRFFRRKKGRH